MGDWNPLFNLIRSHFQDLGISITEVVYWGNWVHIVLEHRNIDTGKLPSQAANIACCYLYDDEMGRPSTLQACGLTDPGNPDDNRLRRLVGMKNCSSGDRFFLDLPGTGCIDIILQLVSYERVPSDDHAAPEQQ